MCIYGLCVVSSKNFVESEYKENMNDNGNRCISLSRLFKGKIKYAVGFWPKAEEQDTVYIIAVPSSKPPVRIIFLNKMLGPQFVYPHMFSTNRLVLFSVPRNVGISGSEILEIGVTDENAFNNILLKVQYPYADHKRALIYSDELDGYEDDNIIVEKDKEKGFYTITSKKP